MDTLQDLFSPAAYVHDSLWPEADSLKGLPPSQLGPMMIGLRVQPLRLSLLTFLHGQITWQDLFIILQ